MDTHPQSLSCTPCLSFLCVQVLFYSDLPAAVRMYVGLRTSVTMDTYTHIILGVTVKSSTELHEWFETHVRIYNNESHAHQRVLQEQQQ